MALVAMLGIVVASIKLNAGKVSAQSNDSENGVYLPLIRQDSPLNRRLNMPYLGPKPPDEPVPQFFSPAIAWFGEVTSTKNYADVRVWYYDDYIKIFVNIIDRRLWYDTSPSATTLEEWDAVSLYFNRDGNSGHTPSANAYRFVAQLGSAASHRTSYRGNGSTWQATPISFSAESSYRGSGPNTNLDNKGWQLTTVIPFSSFGLASPPSTGTVWGLAVAVHDRDDATGTAIADQRWPEQMNMDKPASWGQLHFGEAHYNPQPAVPEGTVTIRNGLNGISVSDAHVGGNFTCGSGIDHWSEWGETNYAGSTQINIQNQWDISDYPCFSKYYVTFPLDLIPAGKAIISAKLSMSRFGNAGGDVWGDPPDSYIQVSTIGEDWDENTLTWNNAPLALENISGAWVKPVQFSEQSEYSWDVTKGVLESIRSGSPLRLAMYSIDGERHSGKYFWSSDSNDWGGTVRPTLEVTWGTVRDSVDVEYHLSFLPVKVE